MQQTIGDITVGDGSTVYAGTFNSYGAQQQRNAQQALSFPEMYNRLHEILVATSGTCSWILKTPTLKNWQNAQCGLLWIKGKPGVGKSTIMKHMWNHFALVTDSIRLVKASFFCHGRGVDLQKSPSGVYRALLHQIVQHVPPLQEDFEERYQARCKTQGSYGSAWDWTESELRSFTRDYLLRSCRDLPLLVFVDALDECEEDSARALLDFFQGVLAASEAQSDSRLKICVSSRHYPLVRTDVLYEVIVDGENLADIRTCVTQKLDSFRKDTQRYDELVSAITSRAGEIFQWSVLVAARVVRSLEGNKPVELILQEIKETPQDLFQLYRQIVRSRMDNIQVNPRDRKQFSDLLQWVALAKRPLSVLELGSALSINHSKQHVGHPHEDECLGGEIEHLSCGLAKVVEVQEWDAYSEVRHSRLAVDFIHISAQEYIVSGGGLQDLLHSGPTTTATRLAELDIVRICYKSILLSQPQPNGRTEHPLCNYAARHIFDHARSAEEGQPVQNDLAKILNFPEDDFVSKMYFAEDDSAEDDSAKDDFVSKLEKVKLICGLRVPKPYLNLLHIAAARDIPNLVSSVLFLAPGLSINSRTGWHKTALHHAAELGSFNAIDRLLDISQTFSSKSMLHWRQRRLRVLQMNVRDPIGMTPLMLAAHHGHSRVVERLAQTPRVDLHAKDRYGHTALHLAIRRAHVDAAKILIYHGANVRAKERGGDTPLRLALHRALHNGSDESMRARMFDLFWSLLPQARQDLYLRDHKGIIWGVYLHSWTTSPPLEIGLSSSISLEFAQGLLDRGLDPHTPDQNGCVWFSYLGSESNPETLDLLQALPGANINFKDKDCRTLLARLAASNRIHRNNPGMLKSLLKYPEVDVFTRDKYGKTPLIIAVEEGSVEVIKILLAGAKCDPQAVQRENRRALDYARRLKTDPWVSSSVMNEIVALLESSCY